MQFRKNQHIPNMDHCLESINHFFFSVPQLLKINIPKKFNIFYKRNNISIGNIKNPIELSKYI